VLDYLAGKESLAPFCAFAPTSEGLAVAIRSRQKYPVNREALVKVLKDQYKHLPETEMATANIDLLASPTTFTICTAHQPNLGTGYLYFIYKILHAVKLATELKQQHPDYNFVPVYYMGSEDADLEELGTFRYGNRKFVWDGGGQTGAVGRMDTATLAPLLRELFTIMGPPGPYLDELKALLQQAYNGHSTIAQATQYLVHGLFGRYGLIVLDPDSAILKQSFIPVMEDDLLGHTAERLVSRSIDALTAAHYKAQAHPRTINLFYLHGAIRERIEVVNDKWAVVNTDISWDKPALLQELHAHPERFSPNVMLRPLYQETILPDIAFIGGGAEVAYWLQLRSLFQHHKVFYPTILLRQSIMWISAANASLQRKTGLSIEALFPSEAEVTRNYVLTHSANEWQTSAESAKLDELISSLRDKAASVDPTLRRSADATLTRMKHLLQSLEQKMLRAEKRRLHTGLAQIARLQASLFPNGGLQERVENFMQYYLDHGEAYFDEILHALSPLRNEFLIIEEPIPAS
jgi:bacillithiol biosynthesis cysteine-adding enzyme BshC